MNDMELTCSFQTCTLIHICYIEPVRKYYFLYLIVILTTTSCIDKYGCRDEDALNYSEKANRSDYTCIYESKGFFYWDQTTENNFADDTITHLTIMLAGEEIVHLADVSNYNASGTYNGCTSTAWIHYEKHIYSDDDYSPQQHQLLEVYDQDDSLIYNNLIELGNDCNTFKINY